MTNVITWKMNLCVLKVSVFVCISYGFDILSSQNIWMHLPCLCHHMCISVLLFKSMMVTTIYGFLILLARKKKGIKMNYVVCDKGRFVSTCEMIGLVLTMFMYLCMK